MFELFNWFGSILGYLLWFLYSIVRNYGVSILLFTIIMKLLMFPLFYQAAAFHGISGKAPEECEGASG